MEKSQQVLKRIARFVLLAHTLMIIFLVVNLKTAPKKNAQRLTALKERVRKIERPIAAKPKVKAAVVAQAPASSKEAAKKSVSAPAKSTPKKTTNKPTVSKEAPKVATKKETPKPIVKKEEWVALKSPELPKAQKIKDTQETAVPIVIPQHLTKLSVESLQDEDEEDDFSEGAYEPYYTHIRDSIEKELNLQPKAFVSIELTLNKNGDVIDIKHINSSDVFSKEYVLSHVKLMKFSAFFGEISKESEYTFTLTTTGPNL